MTLQRNVGAVRRFTRAMRFDAWLQLLPERLVPPPFRLIQIGSAFWQSRALYVAARLDIATVLGDAHLNAPELAARISADAMRWVACCACCRPSACSRRWRRGCFATTDSPNACAATIRSACEAWC